MFLTFQISPLKKILLESSFTIKSNLGFNVKYIAFSRSELLYPESNGFSI